MIRELGLIKGCEVSEQDTVAPPPPLPPAPDPDPASQKTRTPLFSFKFIRKCTERMFSDNLERFYRQFWGVVVTGFEISISVDVFGGGRQGTARWQGLFGEGKWEEIA